MTPDDRRARFSVGDVGIDDEKVGALMADVLRRLAETREARWALANDQRRFSYVPRETMQHFRCSFCGAHRADVLKLISGPRVFICDGCVGDATAVVMPLLREA